MDKKRIKAWLNSVKKLLTCNFIRHLGSLLANALGRDETPTSANPSSQDYLQFLKEVLQATAYSDGNPDDVYRLLQANLNKLDDNLIAVLQNWAEATFSEVESLAAEGIALLIGSFGDLIRQFPLGNKAANVEISLASYDIVLTVFTRDSHSEIWATIQNSLGYAYLDRIKGDRGENLELAIAAYQQALEIFTQQAFPTNSAVTQNNLGNAYLDSIKGDRGENLELAIATWATTQNNLGNAYWNRIKGDRGENLELAIAAFQQALDIYTSSAFPTYWATIQNSLGNVYGNRIKGDRGENLELAIAAFQQALEIYTQESFPTYWATIQNNLGNAYLYRIKGDRGENLELAIAAYQLALHIYTQEAFPNAMCNFLRKNNCLEFKWLKMLFSKLPQCGGHRKVAHGVFPTDWAMTQNNLGNAYRNRIKGDRDENLELAIAAYQLALQIRTQEAFPTDWAMTQNNLGTAYSDRIKGNRGENLELAIAAYQLALHIYTPEADPIKCLATSRNLGNLHFTEGNWQPAIAAYENAIAAVELSRSWAINYKRREEIIAEAIDVYQNLVQAYINTNQWDKAIETVERSKARNLVELLAKQNLKPKGVPQEISAQLDELQRSISSLERQLQVAIDRLSTNTSGLEELQRQALEESRQQLQQEWQDSRQQLDEVLNQIKPFDPSFSLTQNEGTIRFEEIQSLVGEQTAMIEWYVTDDSIITSIITRHSSQPTIVSSSAEEREAFVDWVSKYLGAYKQYKEKRNEQWKNDLSSDLAELAEILNIDQTLAEVDSIFAPQGIKCDRLILVPHRFLHLLPLHAMPLEKGGLLCDRFDVGYAPSCQLLQLTQTQQRPDFQRLFAIQDPEENLAYSILEVETIRSFFSPATVLATKAAREEDVKTHPELSLAHCNHFSCHGEFNLESPLESALRLAEIKQSDSGSSEDGYLTLAEIFALNLTQSRLVTLSACETGIVDVSKPIDEYVSLPSGFLFAGSPSVVCSQWKADDFSTSLLMMKFYENLQLFPQRENGTVALALNQAQKWLRNLTCKDGEEFLDFIEPQWKLVIANLPEEEGERVTAAIKGARKRMLKRPPYPFANPYYWAAFTATGF
ncbi:MAG: CHAT domain-containing protein [Hormoscilla sp.]